MAGPQGRDAQETFLRSLMWDRPRIQRAQLEPELQKLFDGTYQIMMGRDLSKEPEIFGRNLVVRGLFIYKLSSIWMSEFLSPIPFDAIVYNEIDLNKVVIPAGYIKVRLRDLQEFPYTAALRVHWDE